MKSYDDYIAESLKENDSQLFTKTLSNKLQSALHSRERSLLARLNESSDSEMGAVSAIQAAAKSYGGNNYSYDQGVLTVVVPDKQAALDLANYLDSNDDVDSYDVVALTGEDDNSTEIAIDDLTKDFDIDFEFTIYLMTDNVEFAGEYVDEDEDEEEMEESIFSKIAIIPLTEATKKVVFTATGKKVKMMCPPGQKWSPAQKKCVKMTSSENRKRHMSAIKSAVKRKAKSAKISLKRGLAMKKRAAAGF